MKGRGKREIPEKIRRPTASSGTIPKCENPVTRPGIEPGSPWGKPSGPPRSQDTMSRPIFGMPTRRPPRRPGFNPRLAHSGFSHVRIVPDDAVGQRGFLRDLPFPPALSFRRCSILISIILIGS
ncbi:hypothetical protein PR048_032172 [Dryococelus australis]|uniref:Uncharacterized protein n=1 Tax=Dryococelus australis TaxID=614101 RepID=A0ABQ9G1H3_9NEOP|nr:hypothetical protein PR048_032172 [Dryococelus australis]